MERSSRLRLSRAQEVLHPGSAWETNQDPSISNNLKSPSLANQLDNSEVLPKTLDA